MSVGRAMLLLKVQRRSLLLLGASASSRLSSANGHTPPDFGQCSHDLLLFSSVFPVSLIRLLVTVSEVHSDNPR